MALKFLSYMGVIIASTAVLLLFDDDPTSVSLYEWTVFAVLIYSAVSLLRLIQQHRSDQ